VQLGAIPGTKYGDAIRRLELISLNLAPKPAPPPVDDQYADEIAQLEGMGVQDRAACIEALRQTDGDVYQALSWLIDNGKLE
jgi:hypothetical protein